MASSVQLGMGLATRRGWDAPLGSKACVVVPPRKARPRSISIIQRRGGLHMASDVILLSARSNVSAYFQPFSASPART